jgi:hypothetical protein
MVWRLQRGSLQGDPMNLVLTMHRDELGPLIHDFLPMRLTLGKHGDEEPAWFEIDTIETMTFLPGHGLRLTFPARVHYPMPLLPSDFTLQRVSLEVVPTMVPSAEGQVLAFRMEVAALDVQYLPGFVDRLVADKISRTLMENATTIAWNFSRTLTRHFRLPQRFSRVRGVEMVSERGDVVVTGDSIIVTLVASLSFLHEPDA